jgi:hypothetical protein
MEQLCDMAFFGKNISRRVVILEPGSFDPVWRKYDKYEPKPVPELKELYIMEEFHCPGSESFLREIFPNCRIVYFE